jgi:hypothetical protein
MKRNITEIVLKFQPLFNRHIVHAINANMLRGALTPAAHISLVTSGEINCFRMHIINESKMKTRYCIYQPSIGKLLADDSLITASKETKRNATHF